MRDIELSNLQRYGLEYIGLYVFYPDFFHIFSFYIFFYSFLLSLYIGVLITSLFLFYFSYVSITLSFTSPVFKWGAWQSLTYCLRDFLSHGPTKSPTSDLNVILILIDPHFILIGPEKQKTRDKTSPANESQHFWSGQYRPKVANNCKRTTQLKWPQNFTSFGQREQMKKDNVTILSRGGQSSFMFSSIPYLVGYLLRLTWILINYGVLKKVYQKKV